MIVVVIATMALLLYGCYNTMDVYIAGKLTIILIYLLLLVIVFAVTLYTSSAHMCIITALVSLAFGFVLVDAYYDEKGYVAFVPSVRTKEETRKYLRGHVPENGNYPVWAFNGKSMLGTWTIVYIVIIIIAWMTLLKHNGWDDIGLYAIAIYMVIVILFASSQCNELSIGPVVTVLLSGMVLLVWLSGSFQEIVITDKGN